MAADPPDPNLGRKLAGKYEIVRLLGRGGMGAVYEGKNPIGKRIAVKLLLTAHFAQNRELVARFFREAKASAAIESRHVVDVYETGVDDETGFPFIILAYLRGEDLEQVLRRTGALNPIAAARIVSQAATGLSRAHEAGIIHRDIKPANLFLAAEEGESIVKVLDFGIAKIQTGELSTGLEGQGITKTGAMLGTPLYMSPEQAQGLKSIDARTDLWSLGMCLYHALAGRLPFNDVDTVGKLIVAIVSRDVPPLETAAPWMPADLAAVVHRALDRDPDKRFATARELLASLKPFVNESLALTPHVVVGVQQSLDTTAAAGVTAPRPLSSQTLAEAPTVASGSTPGPGTTAGVSGSLATEDAPRPSRNVPVAVAVAAALVAVAGLFAATRPRPTERAPDAPAPTTEVSTTRTAVTSGQTVSAPAAPVAPAEELKVGILTVKMPDGCTIKVDGVDRTPENGRLELRGEFQRKFLVAVFDKDKKRLMVQEVYLYDNKVDPETLDTSVGVVAVDKPKRRPAPAAGPAPKSAATAAPGGELPARF